MLMAKRRNVALKCPSLAQFYWPFFLKAYQAHEIRRLVVFLVSEKFSSDIDKFQKTKFVDVWPPGGWHFYILDRARNSSEIMSFEPAGLNEPELNWFDKSRLSWFKFFKRRVSALHSKSTYQVAFQKSRDNFEPVWLVNMGVKLLIYTEFFCDWHLIDIKGLHVELCLSVTFPNEDFN